MLMQRVVFIIFIYHRNDGPSILLDKPTGGRIRIEETFLRVTGLMLMLRFVFTIFIFHRKNDSSIFLDRHTGRRSSAVTDMVNINEDSMQ